MATNSKRIPRVARTDINPEPGDIVHLRTRYENDGDLIGLIPVNGPCDGEHIPLVPAGTCVMLISKRWSKDIKKWIWSIIFNNGLYTVCDACIEEIVLKNNRGQNK